MGGLRRAPASGEVVNRACCSRDLGPLDDNEDPSEDDIARFGDETTVCPECGAELHDDVDLCWKCGHAILGGSAGKKMPAWAWVGVALAAAAVVVLVVVR